MPGNEHAQLVATDETVLLQDPRGRYTLCHEGAKIRFDRARETPCGLFRFTLNRVVSGAARRSDLPDSVGETIAEHSNAGGGSS